MFDVDPDLASVAFLITGVFLGAFVAGFAGFGLAAAAGAVLLHVIDPKIAIPLMMICSVFAQCAGLVYLRKTVNFNSALPFIAGGFAGVPIAVTILGEIDADALRTGFGVFLISYSGWAFFNVFRTHWTLVPQTGAGPAVPGSSGARSRPGAWHKGGVGLLAGLVGGLTAMPGVVLTIWSDNRRLPKAEQRGFVQPFILSMQLIALTWMLSTPDLLTADVLRPLSVSLLPLVLGTALGLHLYGRASASAFRLGVLAIVLLSGCGLILR